MHVYCSVNHKIIFSAIMALITWLSTSELRLRENTSPVVICQEVAIGTNKLRYCMRILLLIAKFSGAAGPLSFFVLALAKKDLVNRLFVLKILTFADLQWAVVCWWLLTEQWQKIVSKTVDWCKVRLKVRWSKPSLAVVSWTRSFLRCDAYRLEQIIEIRRLSR